MSTLDLKGKYVELLQRQMNLVNDTNNRVIQDDDDFIVDNANFFNKSFLVVICAYLESYLKEKCYQIIELLNNKIGEASIPYNIIAWSVSKSKVKDKDLKYEDFQIEITEKDIDDEISGNIFRTLKTFSYLGIDLNQCDEFCDWKDSIMSLVNKRNSIVHHNDEASDISFCDVLTYIDTVKEYIIIIDNYVSDKLLIYVD